jgi:hypothetical protein
LEEIGKILPAVFKRQIHRSDALLLELLTPLWPRVVGKGIARQCRPVSFAAGTLTIATSCPTWAVQLRQLGEELRASTNRFLGSELVKKLRVRRDLTMDRPGMQAGEESKPPINHGGAEMPEAPSQLEPEVAGVLQRSYSKYFARNSRKVH